MSRVRVLVWLLLAPMWCRAQTVEYVHTDALGSPVAVTDSGGNVIERIEYEPYGALLNRSADNRPGYTGHVMDDGTGLVYMQQRYYDPQIGRFLSVDPVTPLSDPVGFFNRYKYAANNPYRFVDPDGRQEKVTGSRVSGGFAGARVYGTPGGVHGVHRGITTGEAIRLNFDRNIERSPLGPGGKSAMHLLGDDLVEGMGDLADGNFLPAAKSATIGLLVSKFGPLGRKLDDLIEAAMRPANNTGLSVAARAWDKHAGRPGGSFEPLTGSIAQKNAAASDFVLEVLTNPATIRQDLSRGGAAFRLPSGQGIRYDADGSLSGFLDPPR